MLPSHGSYFKSLLDAHPHKCTNGTYLQEAMVTAHNTISNLTHGPDPWTVAQAAQVYTNVTKCLTDKQWGNKELCRVTATGQTCTTGANARCDGCIPYTGKFSPKGYCGPVPSANPRVFGPSVWHTLHVMAKSYPNAPNKDTVDACNKFTSALPLMLPCDHCGYHLNETIHMYPKGPICASAFALQSFLVYAHNRVNHNVHPYRKDWTYREASAHYQSTHLCLHGNEVQAGNLLRTLPDNSDSSSDVGVIIGGISAAALVLFVALS